MKIDDCEPPRMIDLQAGNQPTREYMDSFEALYEKYYSVIFKILCNCLKGDSSQAENLTQETFLCVARALGLTKNSPIQFRCNNQAHSNWNKCIDTNCKYMKGFITKIAINSFNSKYRKMNLMDLSKDNFEDNRSVEYDFNLDLFFSDFINLSQGISEEECLIFFLHNYKGMSFHEIAVFMGMSSSTVHKHYESARQKLEELLKKHKPK